jgi:phage terminase large subunit-like protein
MNTPTKNLDTAIAQALLRTGDNPILNWMAGNAVTRENAEGYIKISKPSPMSPHRVDGIVALIMALALAYDAEHSPAAAEPEIIVL